jgi:hypothetical protein
MSTSRAAAHFPVGHARRGLQHQQPLRLGIVPLSPRFFGASFFVAMLCLAGNEKGPPG